MVNEEWVRRHGIPRDRFAVAVGWNHQNQAVTVDMLINTRWPEAGVPMPAVCTRDPRGHVITTSTAIVEQPDSLAVDGSGTWACSTCGRPARVIDPTHFYLERGPGRRVVRIDLLRRAVDSLASVQRADLERLLELGKQIEAGELSPDGLRRAVQRDKGLRKAFQGWSRGDLINLAVLLVGVITLLLVFFPPGDDGGVRLTDEQFRQLIGQVATQTVKPPVQPTQSHGSHAGGRSPGAKRDERERRVDADRQSHADQQQNKGSAEDPRSPGH